MTTADTFPPVTEAVAAPREPDPSPARHVARSASNLAVLRIVLMVQSALTAAAITRLLGPATYGVYGAAMATWMLLAATADFGFTLALSRDLPRHPGAHRTMLRTAYEVGLAWSLVLTLTMAALAVAADVTTARGMALLVLAPSLLTCGLSLSRALFIATFRTREVVVIDIAVGALQSGAMVAVAVLTRGAAGVAAVVSATTALNTVLVWWLATRRVGPPTPAVYERATFVRRSAPLGVLAVMTKVYLLIDVVLVGWYVTGAPVGEYAASARLLTIFTGLAGIVTTAALPAFSAQRADRRQLQDVVARVWHWLAVSALPLFVAMGLFAPLVVRIALGPDYDGAVALVRILSIAGVLTVVNNVLGVLMIAIDATRPLFVQTSAAIAVNVVGNVLLLPRYGVSAAAWLTVATEVLITLGALLAVRGRIGLRSLAAATLKPAAAIALAVAVGLALARWQVAAALVSSVCFAGALTALRGWPEEFRRLRSGVDPHRVQ
jgi:O-antigen/teichoic acid export membrane protein